MLLVGILLGYFLILVGFLLLWHEKVYKEEEAPAIEVVEERPDAWAGIDEARKRHPSPDAHAELDALEVDGPVFVRKPEHVVRSGR